MNLTILDPTYSERINNQFPKTIAMLDYLFNKNPKAMNGITGYNIIDDITVLIVTQKWDLIVKHYGEVFGREFELYMAAQEEYEVCSVVRDLLKQKSPMVSENLVNLQS